MIYFRPERLVKTDFILADIWCPYQYPSELDELRSWGADEELIKENILDRVVEDHCHPLYSIPNGIKSVSRDLLYVAVNATFPELEDSLFGYVVLSDGDASCLRIFTEGEDLVFFNAPVEPAENRDPLTRIFGRDVTRGVLVEISPVNRLEGVKLLSQFEIPIHSE